MGLLVEYPMEIEINNSGAIDLVNDWSARRRTKYMQSRMFFLRDLKEKEILKVVWKKGINNTVDVFTKNLMGPDFTKCLNDFDWYGH